MCIYNVLYRLICNDMMDIKSTLRISNHTTNRYGEEQKIGLACLQVCVTRGLQFVSCPTHTHKILNWPILVHRTIYNISCMHQHQHFIFTP